MYDDLNDIEYVGVSGEYQVTANIYLTPRSKDFHPDPNEYPRESVHVLIPYGGHSEADVGKSVPGDEHGYWITIGDLIEARDTIDRFIREHGGV